MDCIKLIEVYSGKYSKRERHLVPCGKCIPCLEKRRNDWSFRLLQEHKASTNSIFLTLTYDNENVPKDYSLKKDDLQKFIKRLRHKQPDKLRYYAVGEYGSRRYRPHYHVLLFNSHIAESVIRSTWDLGEIHVGKVTEASIRYVTKYMVQPELKTPKEKEKQFTVMSRGYGIGAAYLNDQVADWHRSGDKTYAMVNEKKVNLPRYYRDKIWNKKQLKRIAHRNKWQGIKEKREIQRKLSSQGYTREMMADARRHAIQRVASKIKFSQKF